MRENDESTCPSCGKEAETIVDQGAYIYDVCRSCNLIQCPPFTLWEPYDSIEEWTMNFQAVKPPAVFNISRRSDTGER